MTLRNISAELAQMGWRNPHLQGFHQAAGHLGWLHPKADRSAAPLGERMGAELGAETPWPRRMKR